MGAGLNRPSAGACALRHPARVSIAEHSSFPELERGEFVRALYPPIDLPCLAWPIEPHRPPCYPHGHIDRILLHQPIQIHPSDLRNPLASAALALHTPTACIDRSAPAPARMHPPHYPPPPVESPPTPRVPYYFSPFVPPVVFPMRAYQKELAADHLDRLLGKSILDRLIQKRSVSENSHASSANQPQGSCKGGSPDADRDCDDE